MRQEVGVGARGGGHVKVVGIYWLDKCGLFTVLKTKMIQINKTETELFEYFHSYCVTCICVMKEWTSKGKLNERQTFIISTSRNSPFFFPFINLLDVSQQFCFHQLTDALFTCHGCTIAEKQPLRLLQLIFFSTHWNSSCPHRPLLQNGGAYN